MGVGVQGRGGNSAPFPLPFYGDVHMCSLATKNNWDGQPAWPTGSTQPITLTGTSSPNKFFSQKSPITSIRTDTSAGENHQPKGIKWQMAKKPCLQNASKKKKKKSHHSINQWTKKEEAPSICTQVKTSTSKGKLSFNLPLFQPLLHWQREL